MLIYFKMRSFDALREKWTSHVKYGHVRKLSESEA